MLGNDRRVTECVQEVRYTTVFKLFQEFNKILSLVVRMGRLGKAEQGLHSRNVGPGERYTFHFSWLIVLQRLDRKLLTCNSPALAYKKEKKRID